MLHELFDLGVRAFLRIGTAMVMPPATLGDLVLADGAFRAEGTSSTYAPIGLSRRSPISAERVRCARALARRDRPWRAGIFGTYDGFYSQMFALSEGDANRSTGLRDRHGGSA